MNRRWEWIILSVRSLTVFEENIVVTVLAKLVPLFFKSSCAFFSYVLSNWQVSDCDRYLYNNVSKFVWKPFKSPLSLRKWKCFGEASLFNLHHLYFNYHLPAQNIAQFMEDPAVITALNHSGCFGRNLVQFKEKNKDVIHQSKSVRIGKNCAYCLEYRPRPWAGK